MSGILVVAQYAYAAKIWNDAIVASDALQRIEKYLDEKIWQESIISGWECLAKCINGTDIESNANLARTYFNHAMDAINREIDNVAVHSQYMRNNLAWGTVSILGGGYLTYSLGSFTYALQKGAASVKWLWGGNAALTTLSGAGTAISAAATINTYWTLQECNKLMIRLKEAQQNVTEALEKINLEMIKNKQEL